MKKKKCVECHVDQRNMYPIVQHVDGKIDYVCKRCWKIKGYPEFVREPTPMGVTTERSEDEPTKDGTVEDLHQL